MLRSAPEVAAFGATPPAVTAARGHSFLCFIVSGPSRAFHGSLVGCDALHSGPFVSEFCVEPVLEVVPPRTLVISST